MVDSTGTTTYTPDALDRLSSVTFPGSRTVSYGYSNVGNRTSITYPGGSNQVTYGYDAANNLTSVTDWNSQQTTYGYNNAGYLTTVTLPTGTGVVGTYGYDNADRLTSVSWVKSGTTLASATYTLDNVGNRTQRVDQLGTHTYGYDNLYRLTSVTYPGPSTDSYTYDAVGNRLTKTGVTGGYVYDAADRMTSAGGMSYGYDNNGNLTSRGTDSFSWDAEDRMTSATVGGTTTTFAYNGDGLRQTRTVGGNTTTFTWDVNQSIEQILDDGSFKYVYGLERIAEVGPGSTTHYYLSDGLGSVMGLVDSSGAVVNTYNYDVFGALRSSTGTQANEFKFTGEQVDSSTELEYLRARYYEASTERFLSRDSVYGSAEQPLSQHLQIYALANPVLLTDSTGHVPTPSPVAKPKERLPQKGPSGDKQANCGGRLGAALPFSSCDRGGGPTGPGLPPIRGGSAGKGPFGSVDNASAKALGVSRQQLRNAVEKAKQNNKPRVPTRDSVRIDLRNGDIVWERNGEVIGNVLFGGE
jgi:RHS repeat-associated protein